MKKLLLIPVLALAACSGPLAGKQQYAGITSVEFNSCFEEEVISQTLVDKIQVEGVTGEQLTSILNALPVSWAPCSVKIVDGKEQGAIDFKFAFPDGSVMSFAADDVSAFEGQRIRGEVDKIVAQELGRAAPEVTNAIMDAITGGIDLGGGE